MPRAIVGRPRHSRPAPDVAGDSARPTSDGRSRDERRVHVARHLDPALLDAGVDVRRRPDPYGCPHPRATGSPPRAARRARQDVGDDARPPRAHRRRRRPGARRRVGGHARAAADARRPRHDRRGRRRGHRRLHARARGRAARRGVAARAGAGPDARRRRASACSRSRARCARRRTRSAPCSRSARCRRSAPPARWSPASRSARRPPVDDRRRVRHGGRPGARRRADAGVRLARDLPLPGPARARGRRARASCARQEPRRSRPPTLGPGRVASRAVARRAAPGRSSRWPRLSAALTGVLFLLVLLLVSGWSVEPLAAAAAVSVLPGRRVRRRPDPRRRRGAGERRVRARRRRRARARRAARLVGRRGSSRRRCSRASGWAWRCPRSPASCCPSARRGQAAGLLSIRHAGITRRAARCSRRSPPRSSTTRSRTCASAARR